MTCIEAGHIAELITAECSLLDITLHNVHVDGNTPKCHVTLEVEHNLHLLVIKHLTRTVSERVPEGTDIKFIVVKTPRPHTFTFHVGTEATQVSGSVDELRERFRT